MDAPLTERERLKLQIIARAQLPLAEQRAGTDKLREQVNETLCRWFIPGKTE